MAAEVLLVEDDPSVNAATGLLLTRAGLAVTAVEDGGAALEAFRAGAPATPGERHRFDVIVLDVMLPTVHGLDVCREIRRTSSVPIIMLSARTETADVVAGLELGADDYVTKPFQGPELVARVRAALRRATPDEPDAGPGAPPEAEIIRAGDLVVDHVAFRATEGGCPIDLSATEFRLLLELARHPDVVLTREVLLERVWGYDYLGDSRLVDMAIKRLRSKLGDDPKEPRYITTVRGVGYRFARF